jgi:signal transduction histidine kinase
MMPIRTAVFICAVVLSLPIRSFGASDSQSSSPDIKRIVIGQPLQPDDENQLVEVEGTVTFFGRKGRTAYLQISSDSGTMQVTVQHGAGIMNDLLLNSRVRVRGICQPVHSVDGKTVAALRASNANDITILQVPEETWQRYPETTLNALPSTNFNGLIHLRGAIQSVKPGNSFSFADATGEMPIGWKPATPELAGMKIELLCGWRSVNSNRVLHAGFFRTLTSAQSLPTLTAAEKIRWLKRDEANKHYPVKLRGVITYIGSTKRSANLQDETGGIFLWNFNLATNFSNVNMGDFCEVEGVTDGGRFSPQVLPQKVTILGAGQWPEPARPSPDELIYGGLDAEWVEVKGIVQSAKNGSFEIGIRNGKVIQCLMAGSTPPLDAVVHVQGVVFPAHNAQRQIVSARINVPSPEFVSVEQPPLADPFSAATTHPRDLFLYDPAEFDFRQVKVAGQVVLMDNDICHIMDGTNGIRLVPKVKAAVNAGDMVEAVGFPDIDSPFDKPIITIRQAVLRITGTAPLPLPMKIAPESLPDRSLDSRLVQLKSQLLNVNEVEKSLELQSGTLIYHARLETAAPLPPLRIGSLLEVTGVYVVSSDQPVPFELLLNSPANIRVLELPSWWTVQHAIFVVSTMAALILLAVIWIGMLRRQVERRTIQLSNANKSLTNEMAERQRTEEELVRARALHLVEQERTRIARDLHDDLGSRTTRMVLLLDELALQNQIPSPDAAAHPTKISTVAREMIQSLDETVWAVNPRNDTLRRLVNYIGQSAMEFLNAAGARCRLDFSELLPEKPISADARYHLLLAVKEALHNAIRHGHATEVQLHVVADEESLVLEIADNGVGFESVPDNGSANGLRNMRQRMEEIGGQFEIKSELNAGTQVTLKFFWPRNRL